MDQLYLSVTFAELDWPNPGGWQLTCVIIPRSTYEAFRVLKCHKSSRSRIIDRTSIGISVFHLETNFVVSVVYIICQEEDKVTTQEVIFLLPKSVAMKQFVPRQLIYGSD